MFPILAENQTFMFHFSINPATQFLKKLTSSSFQEEQRKKTISTHKVAMLSLAMNPAFLTTLFTNTVISIIIITYIQTLLILLKRALPNQYSFYYKNI